MTSALHPIAFIGGGNIASAIIERHGVEMCVVGSAHVPSAEDVREELARR